MKLFEVLVDAANRFKDKRRNDFENKLRKVQQDLPNAFGSQERLEQEVEKQLKEIEAFGKKRCMQYAFLLQPLTQEYEPDVSPLAVVYYNLDDSELARTFTREHKVEILKILEQQLQALNALDQKYSAIKWPAGDHHRYTNYDYVKGGIYSMYEKFKSFV